VKAETQEESLTTERHRIHHQASHAVSNLTTFLGSLTVIMGAVALIGMWAVGLFFVPGGLFNYHYEMVVTSVTTMITFALLIAKDGLDEAGLLGLEDKPDATIKDVQSEVHDAERKSAEDRDRLVISANVGVRPSDHQPEV
jgi:hypothetical protein